MKCFIERDDVFFGLSAFKSATSQNFKKGPAFVHEQRICTDRKSAMESELAFVSYRQTSDTTDNLFIEIITRSQAA